MTIRIVVVIIASVFISQTTSIGQSQEVKTPDAGLKRNKLGLSLGYHRSQTERIEKELPNGWIYSITGQLIIAADGNTYEGPGIPPDIEEINTVAEINSGVDRVLEKAIEIIWQQKQDK